jgi:guanyl-specific ribonuclease Sa
MGLVKHQQDIKGGGVFKNKEGYLPSKEQGYYKEWDTTPKNQGRTAERLVTGKNGEVYYTNTHYGDPKYSGPSFSKISNNNSN